MRLFIAVKLNKDIEDALISAQEILSNNNVNGNYTNCRDLHLTLAFIGEFENVDLVLDAMKQVHFKPFSLSLGGYIGSFNNLLWAGIEQNNYLEKVARQIRRSLAEHNIQFDKKKFNPHITILRRAKFSIDNEFSFLDVKINRTSMTVNKISLMCSERGKNGVIYTEIGSVTAGRL